MTGTNGLEWGENRREENENISERFDTLITDTDIAMMLIKLKAEEKTGQKKNN